MPPKLFSCPKDPEPRPYESLIGRAISSSLGEKARTLLNRTHQQLSRIVTRDCTRVSQGEGLTRKIQKYKRSLNGMGNLTTRGENGIDGRCQSWSTDKKYFPHDWKENSKSSFSALLQNFSCFIGSFDF